MNLDDNTGNNVTATETPSQQKSFQPVAHWLHTVFLIAVLFGFSYLGAVSQHRRAVTHGSPMLTYVLTLAYEWILLGIVMLGIRRRGVKLRELISGRWRTGSSKKTVLNVLRDIGVAIAFLLVTWIVLALVAVAAGLGNAGAVAETKARIIPLAPTNLLQLGIFVLLSLTAGFCEEILCRGYLQRQFAALTQNESLAIVLQGIVFGVSHGYQGPRLMIVLTVFGLMFGLLAVLVKNLRPGMIAHALTDIQSGIRLYNLAR